MSTGGWQAASGLDDGFEALYRRELRALIALGTSLTGSRETGIDLAHEAMLRAYRGWPTVSTLDRPGAWVRRVLINLAIDTRRRRQRERRALERMTPDAHAEMADPVTERFWISVRALPERQRAAVALHYIDDMSVDDIAEVLQVAAGTVKTALFRARKTLAEAMQAEEVR